MQPEQEVDRWGPNTLNQYHGVRDEDLLARVRMQQLQKRNIVTRAF